MTNGELREHAQQRLRARLDTANGICEAATAKIQQSTSRLTKLLEKKNNGGVSQPSRV